MVADRRGRSELRWQFSLWVYEVVDSGPNVQERAAVPVLWRLATREA